MTIQVLAQGYTHAVVAVQPALNALGIAGLQASDPYFDASQWIRFTEYLHFSGLRFIHIVPAGDMVICEKLNPGSWL